MNCNELRDRMESGRFLFRAESGRSAEVAAHIEHCSACRQWIEMEEQLSHQLRLLQENAPALPATLNESVLKGYRARLQGAAGIIPTNKAIRPRSTLVWRAAVAAVLLVGAIILFGNRKAPSPPLAAKVQPQPIASATQPESPTKSELPSPSEAKRISPRAPRKTTVPRSDIASPEAAENSLPPDFRNLMYCDQLSCSGAMDVIRMNLPASAFGLESPLRISNVVAADVVVGPDGVARAIRIVN
jgi:hypothetical protein